MLLVFISIVCGVLGILLASLLGLDGSKVNGTFVFGMWMIGFFSPSIYVLGKLYEDRKKNKL